MTNVPVEVTKSTPAVATMDGWRSMRTEMDRLFDRFASDFGVPAFRRMFDLMPSLPSDAGMRLPAIDIAEDEAAYKITAELPGLTEKDVDVTLTDNILTIKGEKSADTEQKSKNYHVTERSYGSFQRAFALPSGVQAEKIEAHVAHGVLTVTLPKGSVAEKKTIAVKAAA